VSGPSVGDLRALVAKWRAYEGVSSNPGECDDDAFAMGTEWGISSAAQDLNWLLKSYGQGVPLPGERCVRIVERTDTVDGKPVTVMHEGVVSTVLMCNRPLPCDRHA
jgi:hypothetical protein